VPYQNISETGCLFTNHPQHWLDKSHADPLLEFEMKLFIKIFIGAPGGI
jgi:hypothetical protein